MNKIGKNQWFHQRMRVLKTIELRKVNKEEDKGGSHEK